MQKFVAESALNLSNYSPEKIIGESFQLARPMQKFLLGSLRTAINLLL